MNELFRLQEWFKSQCDGQQEHDYGISISSSDNPGWWVKIDLAGTTLEKKQFTPLARNISLGQTERIAKGLEPDISNRGSDWMLCEVKDKVFHGAGDPDKLQIILGTFLDWIETK